MKVSGKVLWRDIFEGEGGRLYVSGVDLETGGDLKLTFLGLPVGGLLGPGGTPKEANFEAVVKGRTYQLSVSYEVQEYRAMGGGAKGG